MTTAHYGRRLYKTLYLRQCLVLTLKNKKIWRDLIDFWFTESGPDDWFAGNDEFDARIKSRFLKFVQQALNGRYDDWRLHPQSRLALILLLDQMARNVFRGTPRAYDGDEMALDLTFQALLDNQLDTEADVDKRIFLLMPLMHSEDRAIQVRSVELFETYGNAPSIDYAKRHFEVIDEFGRFPHRNEILGRKSTAKEKRYLKQPDAGF